MMALLCSRKAMQVNSHFVVLGFLVRSHKTFAACNLEPPSGFFNMLEALPGIR